jgi:hypothetical protein
MPHAKPPLAIRITLLIATLAYGLFVAVLALTPIAWEAAGSPAESYPELFYVGFGWPSALALLAANSVLWIRRQRQHNLAVYLVWTGLVLIVWLCALVAVTGILSLSRSEWTPTGFLESISALSLRNYFSLLLVAAACVIVGGTILLRAPRRPA